MVPRFPRTAPLALGLLSLASCRGTERPSAVPNDAPATIEVPATRPESSTGTALPIDAGDVPLTALLQSADWKRFKALWQELDALDAPTPSSGFPGPPTIPQERSRALRDEVAALGSRLRTLVSEPVALDVLLRVTETRLDGLSGMHARLMMSHRAPFPGELAVANGVLALEKRLDSLLALRKQQTTDPALLRSALGALREDIEFLGLLRSLPPRIVSSLPSSNEHTIAELQAALAQREAEAQQRGEPTQHIAQLRNEVEQFSQSIARVRPTLDSLVADLER